MASTVDLSALVSNLGNYFRDSKGELITNLYQTFSDSIAKAGIVLLDDVKDERPLPNLLISDLMKRGKSTFSAATNAIKMDSRTLKARPFQADISITPQDFEATWASNVKYSKGTYTTTNFPFYQYLVTEIMKKIDSEMRKAIWKSKYDAGGTNNWTSVTDGFLEKVNQDVLAGKTVEVTTGVVTSSNIVQSIEAVVSGLGDEYKDNPGVCVVSRTLFDWYIRSDGGNIGRYVRFNELSGDTNQAGQAEIYVRGTNIKLVHEPSFGSSQRIIASTERNMFVGVDGEMSFDVDRYYRDIIIMVDGKIGTEFALADATYRPVSVNDQA